MLRGHFACSISKLPGRIGEDCGEFPAADKVYKIICRARHIIQSPHISSFLSRQRESGNRRHRRLQCEEAVLTCGSLMFRKISPVQDHQKYPGVHRNELRLSRRLWPGDQTAGENCSGPCQKTDLYCSIPIRERSCFYNNLSYGVGESMRFSSTMTEVSNFFSDHPRADRKSSNQSANFVFRPPGSLIHDFFSLKFFKSAIISFHSFGKSLFSIAHACFH